MTAIPLAVGAVALLATASVACQMRRARGGPGALPPAARLEVMAMATRKPATYPCPATRWSRDDLGAALCQRRTWTMSRSRIWRIREEADRKPPRRVYGLHSHAPDLASQAHDLCSLSLHARRFFAQGRVGIGTEAKTRRQRLERQDPTPPLAPGQPETRAQESIRHGPQGLLASCVVPTGQGVWHLGHTRPSAAVAAHVAHVVKPLPDLHRYDWVVANLHTPWRLDVGRVGAQWGQGPFVAQERRQGGPRRAFLSAPSHQQVFHFTPTHGAWLHQVAWWLSVLARRLLQRGDCCAAQDFATRLRDYLEVYHPHQAHPYRGTYTGQPLVRATPCSQTRRQQRQGRAWGSPRPKRFERVFSPPRPYKRTAA